MTTGLDKTAGEGRLGAEPTSAEALRLYESMAEIWAKREGICQGMGGSMHVADLTKGILGANGIVGAGLSIATGAAFGAKLDGDGKVAVYIVETTGERPSYRGGPSRADVAIA
jgi:TPP-dependent pyruvate/acetoin dehydrogenase alpha subunit